MARQRRAGWRFRPVSRWAETIHEGRLFPAAVQRAFHLFRTQRPGPVALSLPTDLLVGKTVGQLTALTGGRPACDPKKIDEAAEVHRRARRPLIVTGGGAVAAEAGAALATVARRLGAPVLTSVMGRGILPETDPLWLGIVPNWRASKATLESADVILAVGYRFAHRSTKGLLLNFSLKPEQTLVHIDLDPGVIGRMHPTAVGIVGDARQGLEALAQALGEGAPAAGWDRAWLASQRDARWPRYTETADRFIKLLRQALPEDGIVVNDQTGINYWMEWHFPVLRPRTFLYPIGSATLGYGVPAAIGAKVACPDRAVVAVIGDGGFMFSVNELATAVKYGLGIVFLVMNDERYGAIKYLQDAIFGKYGEVDLANPDFPAMARAFGAAGERVADLDALPRALERALKHAGPTVLELPLGVEPPWEL